MCFTWSLEHSINIMIKDSGIRDPGLGQNKSNLNSDHQVSFHRLCSYQVLPTFSPPHAFPDACLDVHPSISSWYLPRHLDNTSEFLVVNSVQQNKQYEIHVCIKAIGNMKIDKHVIVELECSPSNTHFNTLLNTHSYWLKSSGT